MNDTAGSPETAGGTALGATPDITPAGGALPLKRHIFVREKSFYRMMLTLALPAALQNLVSFSNNLIDTAMIGSLGEISLAAVAQASQLLVFMTMFLKGVSTASAIMIAQYWGKQDRPRIRQIFAIGLQVSFGVAAIFVAAGAFAPGVVIRLFTSRAELFGEGIAYLRIVAWSLLFYALTDVLVAMLRSIEVVRISLVVSFVSLALNAFGNWVFIFGKLGVPAMGVRGAALATVIARVVELLLVLVFVLKFETRLRLRIREFFGGSREMLRDFVKYGLPLVAADVAWGVVGIGKQMIIGRLPTEAIAANSVTEIVLQLAMMFTWGLASAAAVVIGKSIGARDLERTRQYSVTIQAIFLIFGVLASTVTLLMYRPMMALYDLSPAAQEQTRQFLIAGAVTIWATAYAAACFQGINRGGGDVRFVFRVNLITGWGIVLPLTFLAAFVFHWPPAAVFFCTRSDQIIKVVIARLRLRGDKWIHNITRP